MLVDGGGPFDLEAADFGRTRLLPKLLDRGSHAARPVLLTHPHPTTARPLCGGRRAAGRQGSGAPRARTSRPLRPAARGRGGGIRRTGRGPRDRRELACRGARLTVLHSGGRSAQVGSDQQPVGGRDLRAGRPVGAPDRRRRRADREGPLVRRGRPHRVDLLKVGHHGSRTSTSPRSRAAVRPRVALLSCGRENRFGHPAPETLSTRSSASACRFFARTCCPTSVSSSRRGPRGSPGGGLSERRRAARAPAAAVRPRPDGRREDGDRAGDRPARGRGDRVGRRVRGLSGARRRHREAAPEQAAASSVPPDRRRRSDRRLFRRAAWRRKPGAASRKSRAAAGCRSSAAAAASTFPRCSTACPPDETPDPGLRNGLVAWASRAARNEPTAFSS